ncbi:solute carrier family 22 member 20-like [Oratosquilla oratoria]|uniref:solute carrier family 22 member 20-like n=1 Tax=Oratosquilla oratoria TaxID=337810 RepID=UPI003F75880B
MPPLPKETDKESAMVEEELVRSTASTLELGKEVEAGLDSVFASIGFGVWHLAGIGTNVMVSLIVAMCTAGSAFMSPTLPFRCAPGNASVSVGNVSTFNNVCGVLKEQEDFRTSPNASARDQGNYRNDDVGGGTCPHGFEYDTSVFTSTVSTEWDLVCDRRAVQPLFQSLLSAGSMIGCVMAGAVADKFGRRTSLRAGAFLNVIAAVVIGVTPYLSLLLAARFFLGLTFSMMFFPALYLVLESAPPRYRAILGIVLGVPYSLSVLGLSGVAYLIRDWRTLQLVASAPALLFLPSVWFVDESPRWLMQNDRGEEAVRVLQKAARLHKAEIPSTKALQMLAEEMMQATKSGKEKTMNRRKRNPVVQLAKDFVEVLIQFFATPAMRLITLVMPCIWFLQQLTYLGVMINANNFSSANPFVYVALISSIEVPSMLTATKLTDRFGRRPVMTLGFLISGCCNLAVPFIPADLRWLQWTAVLSGFLSIAGAIQVNYLYLPEVFPTIIRARGVSICSLIGHIGYGCAPFIVEFLGQSPTLPASVVFGVCGLGICVLVPFLPETNKLKMCDVVQDVEDRSRNQETLWVSCLRSLSCSRSSKGSHPVNHPDKEDETLAPMKEMSC